MGPCPSWFRGRLSRNTSSARSRSTQVFGATRGWNRRAVPEGEQERRDRELIELLNELRVALPGVQVLFAFLLAVPFANGFPKLSPLDRDVFFVAFIATVFVTTDFLSPRGGAAAVTAVIGVVFVALWYGLPLWAVLASASRR